MSIFEIHDPKTETSKKIFLEKHLSTTTIPPKYDFRRSIIDSFPWENKKTEVGYHDTIVLKNELIPILKRRIDIFWEFKKQWLSSAELAGLLSGIKGKMVSAWAEKEIGVVEITVEEVENLKQIKDNSDIRIVKIDQNFFFNPVAIDGNQEQIKEEVKKVAKTVEKEEVSKDKPRICANEECKAVLTSSNKGDFCYPCQMEGQ